MKIVDLEKMRRLVLETNTATDCYGYFTIEPFERGYGYTVGNSLRRILLSSLKGAAITSVKITGALHEFAVLKGVREDVAQIILNLKKIRVRLNSDKTEYLYMKVNKGGKVTAADIDENASVEVMNPEQEIANVDSGTVFEMELTVSSGKGYVLAEEFESHVPNLSVGTIFLDALFSPVVKVNYEVENTRVERSINYDRLVIEIWTDGSISPRAALAYSAEILRNSLVIFLENSSVSENVEVELPVSKTVNQLGDFDKKEVVDNSIDILALSARTLNCLRKIDIKTIKELLELGEDGLINLENIGKRSVNEISRKVKELGLSFS
ncbi:MAG: DNA-directed RNA polymerase subunit alpha [Elusimicrobiota bacterium]|jgi:DNA-directed RNA polymerase subunit alpha|nr:DNA-directed RNA polymerase subunit alpha [Elusimicrobiota bacterium]